MSMKSSWIISNAPHRRWQAVPHSMTRNSISLETELAEDWYRELRDKDKAGTISSCFELKHL